MGGGWFDRDAIDAERFDADVEQAELEAAGREHYRLRRRSLGKLLKGDPVGAAALCPHGSGSGDLCRDCGARVRWPENPGERAEVLQVGAGPAGCPACGAELLIFGPSAENGPTASAACTGKHCGRRWAMPAPKGAK